MKIAGIDVHKKVLMVVVIDASTPEEKPTRRRFVTMPSELQRFRIWLQQQGVEEGGHGIHRSVLALGVAGVGAPYAFALGAGVFQPCSTGAQA